MLINFKEIPVANSGNGDQDTFEKFARDLFEKMGFEIINEPSRGADGGIDIKILEKRTVASEIVNIYWLVSCKHYAHSGNSVSRSVETDIKDRLEEHNCSGFIGFYSTLPSSGLSSKLANMKIPYKIFDNEKIESQIVGITNMEDVFLRYFPLSYKKWKELFYYTEPINLFEYFLDNKYPQDKEVLIKIYGSIGNAIKSIRKYDSFEKSLISSKTTLILDEATLEYINYVTWETFLASKEERRDDGYDIFVPNKIKEIHGIEINTKVILAFQNFSISGGAILYDNFLIIDSKYLDYYQKLYLNLNNNLF